MKTRRLVFIASLALFLALFLVFVLQLRKGSPAKAVDTEVEGVDLTYLAFSKSNERKLEVKCRQSRKTDEHWLHMEQVVATIYKADKLDEDIRVTADTGRTSEDFNDFDLRGHAVISSPSVTLSSDSFDLKDLSNLSTADPVAIGLKDLSGRAAKGMLYLIRNKVMVLNQAQGVLRRDGIPYDFRARVLRIVQKKNMLILSGDVALDGNGATLRGERLFMQFDEGFVNLQVAGADGNSHFHSESTRTDGTREGRDIRGDKIRMFYTPQGRLERINVQGAGELSLASGKDSGTIRSDVLEMFLDAETQSLQKVRTLARAELDSRGRNNIKISADSLRANYGKDGSLQEVLADVNCRFATDDFSGTSTRLVYSAPDSLIRIIGENTSIVRGRNAFNSSQFLVRTKARELSTDKGVKAKLVPGKKSVLLAAKPIFVTAQGVELSGGGDATRFKDKVTLFQDEIELHAGELLFAGQDNRLSCHGGSDLKFVDQGEPVFIKGKAMGFDPAGMKIVIEGDAQMQQGVNALAAQKIELNFDRDNNLQKIAASDRVTFSKEDISGKAQSLSWLYVQKVVFFRNSAEITRRASGTTRGSELRFDLVSNEITVSGAGDRSETTIHQELP